MKFRNRIIKKTPSGHIIGQKYKGAEWCSSIIWKPVESDENTNDNVMCEVISDDGRWRKGSIISVHIDHISFEKAG